jgi:hypothetical protein
VSSDIPIVLQTWILPLTFCSPSIFHYASSNSFSNEFILKGDIATLCLFIDNPTGGYFSVRLLSKRVNFTESRIEIWTAEFSRVDCPKNKCSASLSSQFLVRIINGRLGFRYDLRGTFKEHDIQTQCGREAIPIWEGNSSFLVNLNACDERFVCDGKVIAQPEKEVGVSVCRGLGVLAVVLFVVLWLWEAVSQPAVRRNEVPGEILRAGTEFGEWAELERKGV